MGLDCLPLTLQSSLWQSCQTLIDGLIYFQSALSCNHTRTPVNEGKCFCPDCGRGILYQWVVLRCQDCESRRESRYQFRRLSPAERCCAQCGSPEWRREPLETPEFYQLHKAQLTVQEEGKTLSGSKTFWSVYHWTEARQSKSSETHPSSIRALLSA